MATQWLIPGVGFINETAQTEWLIPGGGFIGETSVSDCTVTGLSAQSLSLTELAVSVAIDCSFAASLQTLSFTINAATVSTIDIINVDVGSLSMSATAQTVADVVGTGNVSLSAQSLALTQNAAVIVKNDSFSASTQAITLTIHEVSIVTIVLLDSYSEAYATTCGQLPNSYKRYGQSFTPSTTSTLYSAKFYLKEIGGEASGNVVAKIYNTEDFIGYDRPTGAALATSDDLDISFLTTSYQIVEFSFTGSNRISLDSSTIYAVVLEAGSGETFAHLCAAYDGTDPRTHPGNGVYCSAGTDIWSVANNELCFYVYGIVATINDSASLNTQSITLDPKAVTVDPSQLVITSTQSLSLTQFEADTGHAHASCLPLALTQYPSTCVWDSVIEVAAQTFSLIQQAASPIASVSIDTGVLSTALTQLAVEDVILTCEVPLEVLTMSFTIPEHEYLENETRPHVPTLSMALTKYATTTRSDVLWPATYPYLTLTQLPAALSYNSNIRLAVQNLTLSQNPLIAYIARTIEQLQLYGPVRRTLALDSEISRNLDLYGPVHRILELDSIVDLVEVTPQLYTIPTLTSTLSMRLTQQPISTQVGYPEPVNCTVATNTISMTLTQQAVSLGIGHDVSASSTLSCVLAALVPDLVMDALPSAGLMTMGLTQLTASAVTTDVATTVFVDPIILSLALNPSVAGLGRDQSVGDQHLVLQQKVLAEIQLSPTIAVGILNATLTQYSANVAGSFTQPVSTQNVSLHVWDATVFSSSVPRIDTTVGVARQAMALSQRTLAGAAEIASTLYSQVYADTAPQPVTFSVAFDGGAAITVAPTTLPDGTSVQLVYSLSALSAGQHYAIITATNMWGTSEVSDPVWFIKV